MWVQQCLPSARRRIVMEDRGLCVPQGVAKEQALFVRVVGGGHLYQVIIKRQLDIYLFKVVSLQHFFKFAKIHLGFL